MLMLIVACRSGWIGGGNQGNANGNANDDDKGVTPSMEDIFGNSESKPNPKKKPKTDRQSTLKTDGGGKTPPTNPTSVKDPIHYSPKSFF